MTVHINLLTKVHSYAQSDTLLLADVYNNVINGIKKYQGRTFYAIHQYVKSNNKYMKDYDKNKDSLYLIYMNGQYHKRFL